MTIRTATPDDATERLETPAEVTGDDPTDTEVKAFQREHESALTYNTRDLLAKGERAIERMDAGAYGVCESCGQAVGKARPQAFPRATPVPSPANSARSVAE